jgi:hypothetical protein
LKQSIPKFHILCIDGLVENQPTTTPEGNTMSRRLPLALAATLFAGITPSTSVLAQPKPFAGGITIVIPPNVIGTLA